MKTGFMCMSRDENGEGIPSGNAVLQGQNHRFRAVAYAKLVVDMGDVAICGRSRDDELGGNFLRGSAAGK
jgi:hypothetical protein